jgi:hypothetical protein
MCDRVWAAAAAPSAKVVASIRQTRAWLVFTARPLAFRGVELYRVFTPNSANLSHRFHTITNTVTYLTTTPPYRPKIRGLTACSRAKSAKKHKMLPGSNNLRLQSVPNTKTHKKGKPDRAATAAKRVQNPCALWTAFHTSQQSSISVSAASYSSRARQRELGQVSPAVGRGAVRGCDTVCVGRPSVVWLCGLDRIYS